MNPREEALIVCDGDQSIDRLNAKLADGWYVTAMCAMPSSRCTSEGYRDGIGETLPTCLVIIRETFTRGSPS